MEQARSRSRDAVEEAQRVRRSLEEAQAALDEMRRTLEEARLGRASAEDRMAKLKVLAKVTAPAGAWPCLNPNP